MTAETLRLEIEVMVKEALANLKQTSSEMKQFISEAKRTAPATYEVKAAMASLEHDLKTSATSARILGDELGGLKEQQARLKQGIRDLIDRGLSPESAEVKDLKGEYDDTTAALKRHGGGIDDLKGRIAGLMETAVLLAAGKKLADFMGNAVGEFAKVEASTQRLDLALEMRGMQSARGPLQGLATQLQDLAGIDADVVTQLEAELLAQGKSRAEIEKTIKAAAGLSAVTGGDLRSSVEQLNTTYSGTALQLGRMIPEIKDLTEEQLKSGAAVDVISAKYARFIGQTGTTQIAISRMHESLGDVTETFGSLFAPVVRLAADLLGGLAAAIANSGSWFKTVAIIVTSLLFGALAGLLIRTAALTLAKWGLFGAEMAVGSAMAAVNPLIWVGIAAAVVMVGTVTALVIARQREAKATEEAAASQKNLAGAYDQSTAAAQRAVTASASYSNVSTAWLQEELDWRKKWLAEDPSDAQAKQWQADADAMTAELDKRNKSLDEQRKKAEEAAKALKDFRDSWDQIYHDYQVGLSTSPFAKINDDEMKKLAEASAAGVSKEDPRITQIREYFRAQRDILSQQIAQSTAETLAKISKSKVDNLLIEKNKAVEATKDQGIAQWETISYYDHLIYEARKAEAFDAANEERAFYAGLTESRVDDLLLERDRALELFEGTEKQKAALAEYYAKKIADAQIEENKRAFDEALKLSRRQGNYGTFASLNFQQQAASTNIGQMGGFAGNEAIDPLSMLIMDFTEMALSIENVNKLLNPFKTILEGTKRVIEPLLNNGLQPTVDMLVEIGIVIGQVLSPFLSIFIVCLDIVIGILKVTLIPVLQVVGAVFKWLNNVIIVPVGNAFIDIINGVIEALNFALGWAGVHIALLEKLKPIEDNYAANQEQLAGKIEQVNDAMEKIRESFDEKRKAIDEAYDKNIESLKRLLEVGALGEAAYDAMVASYNSQKESDIEKLNAAEKAANKTLQDILDKLNNGIDIDNLDAILEQVLAAAGGEGKGKGGFNSGGLSMGPAILKGGDTGLLRGAGPGGSTNVYYMDIRGSVLAESELLDMVASKTAKKSARGQLPQGATA